MLKAVPKKWLNITKVKIFVSTTLSSQYKLYYFEMEVKEYS
jgi:hypothetical protein